MFVAVAVASRWPVEAISSWLWKHIVLQILASFFLARVKVELESALLKYMQWRIMQLSKFHKGSSLSDSFL